MVAQQIDNQIVTKSQLSIFIQIVIKIELKKGRFRLTICVFKSIISSVLLHTVITSWKVRQIAIEKCATYRRDCKGSSFRGPRKFVICAGEECPVDIR